MTLQTERLALKVLSRDKEALRRMAAAEGETLSVVVRRLIREAARERGLLPATGGQRGTSPSQGGAA